MNAPTFRYLFLLLAMLVWSSTAIPADPPVFHFIQENDLKALDEFLEEHGVNDHYGIDSVTLLAYSIIVEQKDITRFLIDHGADVNLPYDGKTPLMLAIEHENRSIIRLLLQCNALINNKDSQGNTALIYAASKGNLPIVKTLVRKGADINYKNELWNTAYDYAIKSNQLEVSKYLRNQYERHLPHFVDGPYVQWKNNDKTKAFYMVHDSIRQMTVKKMVRLKADTNPFLLEGFVSDTNNYLIRKNNDIQPFLYTDTAKVMVIGDIHGGYDSLILFLQNNGVVDKQLNWIWGQAHLVILGDVFDRGDKVTESLWFIYHLEDQAKKHGGYVHYILGNHEIMVLTENPTYLPDKYYYLTKKLNISYSWLYNKRTVLGKWLRTKNTIIKINNYLFVHAGISPEMAFSGFLLPEINNIVRYIINHPNRHPYGEEMHELILGKKGPFWYRGYLEDSYYYAKIEEQELNNILTIFDVSAIFIGHTNVDRITPLYNHKVYTLDVPFYTHRYRMEGLVIENGDFYLLNSAGEREIIN